MWLIAWMVPLCPQIPLIRTVADFIDFYGLLYKIELEISIWCYWRFYGSYYFSDKYDLAGFLSWSCNYKFGFLFGIFGAYLNILLTFEYRASLLILRIVRAINFLYFLMIKLIWSILVDIKITISRLFILICTLDFVKSGCFYIFHGNLITRFL